MLRALRSWSALIALTAGLIVVQIDLTTFAQLPKSRCADVPARYSTCSDISLWNCAQAGGQCAANVCEECTSPLGLPARMCVIDDTQNCGYYPFECGISQGGTCQVVPDPNNPNGTLCNCEGTKVTGKCNYTDCTT